MVTYEKEDNIDYLLLVAVYINDKSRGRNLGKALIEQTILKNEMQNKSSRIQQLGFCYIVCLSR